MVNIYLAPSQKLPKKGDPGLLFGNIFVPLAKPVGIPTDGLLVYFPLNGNLIDQVSKSAATNAGITFTSDPLFGQVASFNGSARATFTMGGYPSDGHFSISLMIKFTTSNSGRDAFTFGSDGAFKGRGNQLQRQCVCAGAQFR